MTDRIDHAKEAREWIRYAPLNSSAGYFERAALAAALANAEAQLALVEQQRIANLIALRNENFNTNRITESTPTIRAEVFNVLFDATAPFGASPEIREALGL